MSSAPGIRFRPTRDADIERVVGWEQQPENAAFVVVWSVERHREALADPTCRHFIIEYEDSPAGYVILAAVTGTDPVVEFRRIVVARKGRGIGQAAVAGVLDHAFGALGAREVWLDFVTHNVRAAHIYSKAGFRVDPTADAWATVAGKRTRLVKMTMERGAWRL